MAQISFALIGCGREGRSLAPRAMRLPAFRWVAVYDDDPAQAQACAEEWGVEKVDSREQLLAREDVDSVLIATSNDTHREEVEAALISGKAVYVVPPLALTTEDCHHLLAIAAEHQGKLLVGHTRRFHPLLAQLRRTVSLASLGQPVAAQVIRREMVLLEEDSWERNGTQTGGLLRHWGLEEIEFLRAVFGEVVAVYAQAGVRVIREGLDFPDVVSAQLSFEQGMTAQLLVSVTDYLPCTYGSVVGTEGSLSFDLTQGRLHYRRVDGIEVKFEPNEVERAAFAQEAMETVWTNFAAWITEGTEPPVTAADALAAVAIAEAAAASMESGGVVPVEGRAGPSKGDHFPSPAIPSLGENAGRGFSGEGERP